MKKLYLVSDAHAEVCEAFASVKGIEKIALGMARAKRKDVITEPISCTEVTYNPKKLDVTDILGIFFKVINPYVATENELDEHPPYAVCYSSGEDVYQIEYYMKFMQLRGAEPAAACGNLIVNDSITQGHEPRFLNVEYLRLESFSPAE
ncbi:hypothetical protein [Phascolarctobacterium sp.]|uniref:hypothetical protein n=1 Tax=Phascolarctobacterium sp. TaxID=2049039 RepID=UPI00386437D6